MPKYALYADGGVISKNPSKLGGTYAARHIAFDDTTCWKWNNIPKWLHNIYQQERIRLVNFSKFEHVLLDGHPTKIQLMTGIGKRGHPVSIHNVAVDKACGEAAAEFMRNHL